MVSSATSDVRAAVAAVPDPEMPMLTLEDLGVLRSAPRAVQSAMVASARATGSGTSPASPRAAVSGRPTHGVTATQAPPARRRDSSVPPARTRTQPTAWSRW